MQFQPPAPCDHCEHFRWGTKEIPSKWKNLPPTTVLVCAAFPDGIPEDIAITGHDGPLPGDGGLRFTPDPIRMARLRELHRRTSTDQTFEEWMARRAQISRRHAENWQAAKESPGFKALDKWFDENVGRRGTPEEHPAERRERRERECRESPGDAARTRVVLAAAFPPGSLAHRAESARRCWERSKTRDAAPHDGVTDRVAAASDAVMRQALDLEAQILGDPTDGDVRSASLGAIELWCEKRRGACLAVPNSFQLRSARWRALQCLDAGQPLPRWRLRDEGPNQCRIEEVPADETGRFQDPGSQTAETARQTGRTESENAMDETRRMTKGDIPTITGRLLYELSWEGNASRTCRRAGRGRENVLMAEAFQILDWLPRTEFLGEVVRAMHGADEARGLLMSEIEAADLQVLPEEIHLRPSGKNKDLKIRVQPDGHLVSESVYCLIEAKRIKSSSFQPKQLARETVAAIKTAGDRTPMLMLIPGAPPPLTVRGHKRLPIPDAIDLHLAQVIDREVEGFEKSEDGVTPVIRTG